MRERSRQRILRQGVRTPDDDQWDCLRETFGAHYDSSHNPVVWPPVGSQVLLPDGVWRMGYATSRVFLISVRNHVVLDTVDIRVYSGEKLYVFPDGRLDMGDYSYRPPWDKAVLIDKHKWHW